MKAGEYIEYIGHTSKCFTYKKIYQLYLIQDKMFINDYRGVSCILSSNENNLSQLWWYMPIKEVRKKIRKY